MARLRWKLAIAGGMVLWAGAAFSLEPMTQEGMAGVNGRDGIVVDVSAPDGISADQIRAEMDAGTQTIGGVGAGNRAANLGLPQPSSFEGTISANNVTLDSVSADGTTSSQPFRADLQLDVGADGSGTPGLGLNLGWERARLGIGSLAHGGASGVDYGSLALDGSGSVKFSGMIDSSRSDASFDFALNDGALFYRQGSAGSPEVLLDDLNVSFGINSGNTGTVGIDTDGLFLTGETGQFGVFFDLKHRGAPTNGFAETSAEPMLAFGWSGNVYDPLMRLSGGGATYGGEGSEGLRLTLAHDHGDDYAFIAGEAGGLRTLVRFDNWQRLDGQALGSAGTPSFRLPLILDAINAGQGLGGICGGGGVAGGSATTQTDCQNAGGEWLDVPADSSGLAVATRDTFLRAYPTRVILDEGGDFDPDTCSGAGDPDCDPADEFFDWGLISALGDMDANLYLYPGGENSNSGLRIDGTAAISSHANTWTENSHFMIADTDPAVERAFGFLGANVFLEANDLYASVTSEGFELSTDNRLYFHFDGLFGGGDLDDLSTSNRVQLTQVGLSLDTTELSMALTPETEQLNGTQNSYLGLSADMVLTDTGQDGDDNHTPNPYDLAGPSSFSLAEPERLQQDLALRDLTGALSITNGRIDLLSKTQTTDNIARLVFRNTIEIGRTALAPANNGGAETALAADLEFGGGRLVDTVLPGGKLDARLGLRKIQ